MKSQPEIDAINAQQAMLIADYLKQGTTRIAPQQPRAFDPKHMPKLPARRAA